MPQLTLEDVTRQVRANLAAKQAARSGSPEAILIDRIRSACVAGSRNPTEAEANKVAAATRTLSVVDAEIDLLLERLGTLETETARDAAYMNLAREVHPTGAGQPAYDQVARIGQEARTYRPDQDRTGEGFLLDISRAFIFQDPTSHERLARHAAEERVERAMYMERAAGTGAFAGLTVPQYLTDLYAPAVAAMRPFADSATTHHDLPASGMTVNISRITTATSVANQASENTAVSETNIDDTLPTLNILTAAGQQTLSRQSIERGTGVEDVTMSDLIKRYATNLDSTTINQATTGLAAVSTSQSYVNATVDTTAIPATWKQVIQAQNTLEGVLLGQAPVSHVIMHNRRWNWLCAAISASWPVISGTNVPPQSWGMQITNEYGNGVRGVMANGLKIVVDANVSTACLGTAITGGTQDQMYVVAKDECHLWEDPNAPLFIRAEQPSAASLGVLLVVYGYYAYTHSRYTGGSVVVNGTGLATPSFV
jgi:hypothetical protein